MPNFLAKMILSRVTYVFVTKHICFSQLNFTARSLAQKFQSSYASDRTIETLHCGDNVRKDSFEHKRILKLYNGLCSGDRAALAESITLVESLNQSKKELGQVLLQMMLKKSKNDAEDCTNLASYMQEQYSLKNVANNLTLRVGITGPPGAGKSTFIEQFGLYLTNKFGFKVAVLAIDPSSSRTGGSLLGDKTRMLKLSHEPLAYVRPSPSKGELGGVARDTMEALFLCEGAGYDIIIVETVGVGQSEVAVADMTDMFILIIPPAGGDELQGLKRGIIEKCDMVLVNKADGDLIPAARKIQTEYTSALKFLPRKYKDWRPRVRRISSLADDNMSDVWYLIMDFNKYLLGSNILHTNRQNQRELWMWHHIRSKIVEEFKKDTEVNQKLSIMQEQVRNGEITPGLACDCLLDVFFSRTLKYR